MEKLTILESRLCIGIKKPFSFLHVTDTHLIHADEWDDRRGRVFEPANRRGQVLSYLRQALCYARENDLPVVYTGDILDHQSEAGFRLVDALLHKVDYIYAAGNHDFCHRVGEAKEDEEYKKAHAPLLASHIAGNITFDATVRHGVNFVTMDNSYYRLSDAQTHALQAEAAKGLPIVLCMHVPLYNRMGAAIRSEQKPGQPLSMLDAPEEYLSSYTPERQRQQRADEATKRAVAYIRSEPLIKAVVAGHCHRNSEERLENGVVQWVTDGTFRGYARRIDVV